MQNVGRTSSCQLSCGSGRLLLPSRLLRATPCKAQQPLAFPTRLYGDRDHHPRARLCCAAYKGKAGGVGLGGDASRRSPPHAPRGSGAEEGECLLLAQHLMALGGWEEQGARVAAAMDAAEVCEGGPTCLMETLAEHQAGLCCKEVLHWLERRQLAQPAHYTLTIGALGAAGRWEAAEAVFAGMEAAGARRNHFHFAALVEALRRGGPVAQAPGGVQADAAEPRAPVHPGVQLGASGVREAAAVAEIVQSAAGHEAHKRAQERAHLLQGDRGHAQGAAVGDGAGAVLGDAGLQGPQVHGRGAVHHGADGGEAPPLGAASVLAEDILQEMKAAGAKRDAYAYTAAISACEGYEAAAALLAEMRAEGGRPTTSVYNAVLKMCRLQPGGWRRAQDLMRDMQAEGVRADARSWNALLSAAAAASASAVQLTELMQQMRASNAPPDAATFSVVLSACARLGDAPTALALAAQMKEDGVRMDVVACTALMAVHESAGDSDAARSLLRTMEESSLPPNLFTYLHAIGSCKPRGEWRAALEMLDQARGRASLFRSPPPTEGADLRAVVFTAVVQQLVEAGEEERAAAQYRRMRDMGIPPLPGTLTALMKPLAARGAWEEAHQLRVSMVHQGLTVDQAGQELLVMASSPLMEQSTAREALDRAVGAGLVLDLDLYNTLIQVCERMDLPVQAMQLYDTLLESGISPHTCTFEVLLRAVSGGTQPSASAVNRVLSDMHAQGASAPAAAYAALVQASLADALQDGERWSCHVHQLAVQRLEEAGQLRRCSDYNQVLEACARREGVDEFETVGESALHVLRRMEEAGVPPNDETYSKLIQACSLHACGCRQAEQFASEMLDSGSRPSTYTMNCLLNCFKESGHCAGALRWFHSLTDQGVAPDEYTFSILISACEEDWVQARDVFAQMKEFRVQPDTVTYTALLATLKTSGQWRMALQVYKEMKTAGLQPNSVTYSILAEVLKFAEHDALEAAKTVYLEMSQTDGLIEAHTFGLYISLFEYQGDVDMLRRVHTDMKSRNVLDEQSTCDTLLRMCKQSTSRNVVRGHNEWPQTAKPVNEPLQAASTTVSKDNEIPPSRAFEGNASETSTYQTSTQELLQLGQSRPYVSSNPRALQDSRQVDVVARLDPGSSSR
eukprot:CAMPEP_0114300888 /NCGR_PEP_ID=MMETSP0059-20121206/13803_1 /TAXON_ID=36894 /ORGANISM="Pyramimonas parkeae, Strain CCMP726" /LENGTH=1137 /DNA_ID=CAMNT_0001423569 /DNA_START=192 /DNA_END=3605 /DNA_ORIENTATION=+